MTTAHAARGTVSLPAGLVARDAGGQAGGIVFGVLMQAWGMLPMVATLVDSGWIAVGWLVHLANSALFGAIFAVLFGRWAATLAMSAGLGLLYEVLWWVLGVLLIMPAGARQNEMIFQVNADAWRSLLGHLVYGLLLGVVYALTLPRLRRG